MVRTAAAVLIFFLSACAEELACLVLPTEFVLRDTARKRGQHSGWLVPPAALTALDLARAPELGARCRDCTSPSGSPEHVEGAVLMARGPAAALLPSSYNGHGRDLAQPSAGCACGLHEVITGGPWRRGREDNASAALQIPAGHSRAYACHPFVSPNCPTPHPWVGNTIPRFIKHRHPRGTGPNPGP